MTKLATIALVLFVASTADAKPKPKPKGKASLKVHMERAAKAHKEGKFDVALVELQAAYEIDPQPKLVYAIAQVYSKLDKCDEAIEHYEKFIAKTKEKDKHAVAREAIEACKKKQDAFANRKPEKPDKQESSVFRDRKPPENELPTGAQASTVETSTEPVETKPIEPPPEPKPVEPPPPPPEQKDPPPVVTTTVTTTYSPWYRDPIGDALVIGGVAASAVSIVMYVGARGEVDKADEAPTLAEYEAHRDKAEQRQLYAVIAGGAGVVLIATGLLRFKLRDSKRETRGVAIVPTRDGGLITWSGGF